MKRYYIMYLPPRLIGSLKEKNPTMISLRNHNVCHAPSESVSLSDLLYKTSSAVDYVVGFHVNFYVYRLNNRNSKIYSLDITLDKP